MVGAEGKIFFTKDNWSQFALDYNYPDGDTLWSVDAIDPPAFWIVGEAGTIIYVGVSSLFGAQIQDQSLDIPYNLYEIDALDNSHAWAVGQSGTILHFGTEGGAGIADPPVKTFSVFPNPAREILNIVIPQEDVSGEVMLSIFNLMGQKVLDTKVVSGHNEVHIKSLQQGTYILTLNLDAGLYYEKFIKL
jgi:hypothetical protein